MNLVTLACVVFVAFAAAPVYGTLPKHKVAIVELNPSLRDQSSDLSNRISTNIHTISIAAADAHKQGAKLLVVPEYAIINDDYFNVQEVDALGSEWFTRVINFVRILWGAAPSEANLRHYSSATECAALPGWSPDPNTPLPYHVNIRPLHVGCLARKHQIAISFNMLTYRHAFTKKMHNSEITFDKNGDLINWYNKINPIVDEFAGMMAFVLSGEATATNQAPLDKAKVEGFANSNYLPVVCMDLVFPNSGFHRRDANGFILSTEWASSNFLISVGAQQGFSRATKRPLIAANNYIVSGNWPYTGSGIYQHGKPLAQHYGASVVPAAGDTTGYTLLVGEVEDGKDGVARTDLPFADTFDPYSTALPEWAPPDNRARKSTVEVFRPAQSTEDTVITLEVAGGIKCELTYRATNVGPQDRFLMQAFEGFLNLRHQRHCQVQALKPDADASTDASFENPRTWAYYHWPDMTTKFTKFVLKVVGGPCKGCATLPITTLVNQQGFPMALDAPYKSAWTPSEGGCTLDVQGDPKVAAVAVVSVKTGAGVNTAASALLEMDAGPAQVASKAKSTEIKKVTGEQSFEEEGEAFGDGRVDYFVRNAILKGFDEKALAKDPPADAVKAFMEAKILPPTMSCTAKKCEKAAGKTGGTWKPATRAQLNTLYLMPKANPITVGGGFLELASKIQLREFMMCCHVNGFVTSEGPKTAAALDSLESQIEKVLE